jgi:hypothetical protein
MRKSLARSAGPLTEPLLSIECALNAFAAMFAMASSAGWQVFQSVLQRFAGWRVGIPVSRSGTRSRSKAEPRSQALAASEALDQARIRERLGIGRRDQSQLFITATAISDFGACMRFYDSALQADCDCVGAVVCPKLIENARDVVFHSLFLDSLHYSSKARSRSARSRLRNEIFARTS